MGTEPFIFLFTVFVLAVFVAVWLLGDRLHRNQWTGLGALAVGVVLIGLR